MLGITAGKKGDRRRQPTDQHEEETRQSVDCESEGKREMAGKIEGNGVTAQKTLTGDGEPQKRRT